MFKVERISPDRLDIEFGGKLDSIEMEMALDELVDKAEDIEHGKMMYRIGDCKMPTLGALAIEFSRLPGLFRFVRKFDRAAVIAEKRWIKKASEIEGVLIPGLEIKAFGLDQEDEAEQWLMS